MPQRLKSLVLQGYKTFASSTQFEFSKNITAIVGPNGSGKSNITDAIRWVLGEQSYSILRGRKTEDMIFSGSENRPRASMASATMVFDNTDQWLPIEFSEVAITRRAYRDGQNEYLINGQRVRLKDLNELIANAGLSERTYTVIGQGLVDVALSLKAEERRQLIEEAAGIGLYRDRREEALHRLDSTRRNLERLRDILSELEPRLRSLEKQVKRLVEVEQIKKDLKVLLLDWYGYHWHKEQRELIACKDVVSQQENVLEDARKILENKEVENIQLKQKLDALQIERSEIQKKLNELGEQQQKCEQQIAVLQERKRSLEQQQQLNRSEIVQVNEELEYINKNLIEAEAEKNTAEQDLAEVKAKAEQAQSEFEQQKKEWETKKQEYEGLITKQEKLIRSKAEFNSTISETMQRINRLEASINEHQTTLQFLEDEIGRQSKTKTTIYQQIQELEKQYQALQITINKMLQVERELSDQKKRYQDQIAGQEINLLRLKTQYEVLDQSDKTLADYNQAARFLIQNSSKYEGVLGVLGPHLQITAEYEVPIAAVLGEFADTILVEKNARIDEIMDSLNKNKLRGILLQFQNQVKLQDITRRELTSFAGVIGWCDEFIKADPPYQDAVKTLFQNTLLVNDREVVKQLQPVIKAKVTLVTLAGEIFYPNGMIINAGNIEVGKIRRPRQKTEIFHQISEIEKGLQESNRKLAKVNEQLDLNNRELREIRDKAENLREQIDGEEKHFGEMELNLEQNRTRKDWLTKTYQKEKEELQQLKNNLVNTQQQLEETLRSIEKNTEDIQQKKESLSLLSLESLQSQYNQWEIYLKTAQRTLAESRRRFDEKRDQLQRLQNSLGRLNQRQIETDELLLNVEKEIQQRIEEKVIIEKEKEELRARNKPLENSIVTQADLLEKNNREIHRLQANLIQLEQKFAQARILLTRQQERFETLRRRIEEDFGLVAFEYAEHVSGPTPLPIEGMVEKLPVVNEIGNELEENIKRYRTQIKRLGPVNPEARLEYNEVKERYHFLIEQIADLEKAERDIRQIINELDLTMQHDFKTTFELVADEFKLIFSRLFSGGSARLLLTDSDDLSQAGIEIEARLPGKRTQGLSLLSGGERSLTAVALIFALLKVSPTPFCVLDEVDAMLDEANVSRFRDLLEELSENTQFIIVTHNRNTVQVADVVYGVTMGRDSTSQVISLQLDELDKVIKENE